MNTTAAVLCQLKQPLRLMELEVPTLKPGQVLVDLAYTAICHSQLLEIEGQRGPDKFLPHTLGHEGSGVVGAVGPGVSKVKPGDRVVLSWIKGHGADVPSTIYHHADGPVNSGAISTFMTRTVTCENRVTRIPDDMPLREAALLGCAVPTGAGIVFNTANVQAGNSVIVFGTGGIGLSAILGAVARQADPIIAVDIVDHKLALAQKLGATHAINAASTDPLAVIREMTNGRGVDFAIEAAGRTETMETAFVSVRDQGGLCILAGNLPHGQTISINPFDLIKGKRIIGTWGGESLPDRDIPQYVEAYQQGRLPLGPLITHEYSLTDINEAVAALREKKAGRVVLKLPQGNATPTTSR